MQGSRDRPQDAYSSYKEDRVVKRMQGSRDRPQDVPKVNSRSSLAAKYVTYKKLRAATFFIFLFLLMGFFFVVMSVMNEEYLCLGALFIFLAIITVYYVLKERM